MDTLRYCVLDMTYWRYAVVVGNDGRLCSTFFVLKEILDPRIG